MEEGYSKSCVGEGEEKREIGYFFLPGLGFDSANQLPARLAPVAEPASTPGRDFIRSDPRAPLLTLNRTSAGSWNGRRVPFASRRVLCGS